MSCRQLIMTRGGRGRMTKKIDGSWGKAAMQGAVRGMSPLAVLVVPLVIAVRTKELLDRHPGGDITFDGAFTIGDIGTALYWVFLEPAHAVLGYIGFEPLAFFHIAIQSPPAWLTFPLAGAAWIFFLVAGVWGIALLVGAVGFTLQTLSLLPLAKEDGVLRGDLLALGAVGVCLVLYIAAAFIG